MLLKSQLELRIFPLQESFSLSSKKCFIHLSIKNISDNIVKIWNKGFWTNHKIILTNELGEDIPVSEEGIQRRKAFNKGVEYQKAIEIILKKGESYDSYTPINLCSFFRIEKPGIYYFQIIFKDEDTEEILSNKLRIYLND